MLVTIFAITCVLVIVLPIVLVVVGVITAGIRCRSRLSTVSSCFDSVSGDLRRRWMLLTSLLLDTLG